jgi:hypothetical protein
MLKNRLILVVALSALTAPFANCEEDPSDKAAAGIVGKFMAAVKGKDLEAVMRTVEVPWFHKGEEVIKERSELKKEFDSLFAKRDFGELKYEIKRIAAFSAIRDKTMGEERKLLDEVLSGSDRVVLLEIASEKKGPEKLVLLVKLSQDTAWVVGIKD